MKKWIVVLFCMMFMVVGFGCSDRGSSSASHVNSDDEIYTEVSGIINEDTIWDLENSPYLITDTIQIAFGTTLYISDGVEIYSNSNPRCIMPIEVFGTLIAKGLVGSKVKFHNINIKGKPDNSGITLDHIEMFSGRIWIKSGSLSLSNSVLTGGDINDNNNIFIEDPKQDSFIEKNIFIDWAEISVGVRHADVYITRNVFYRVKDSWAIDNYWNFRWYHYGQYGMIVEFNSFLDQNKLAVKLYPFSQEAYMNAENNYWGTTDETIIESMISDRNDSSHCADYISYLPYLTEPDPDVPDITPYLVP